MPPPLRLRSITFDRRAPDNTPLAVPIAPRSGARAAEKDWERTPSTVAISAIAYPRTVILPTMTVEIDADRPFEEPVQVRARNIGRHSFLRGAEAAIEDGAKTRHRVQMVLEPASRSTDGIRFTELEWVWEYRVGTGRWIDFDESRHPVFITLGHPQAPWGVHGQDGRALPWLDVLKLLERWTAGQTTDRGCASELTRSIFGLGGRVIPSKNGEGQAIHYQQTSRRGSDGVFNLSGFLATANLEMDANEALNCSDCARAVALLASVAGVKLRVARVDPATATLVLNAVRLLGGVAGPFGFSSHSVAATTNEKENAVGEHAWDACLQVDMDLCPANTPAIFGFVLGMPFESLGNSLGYKDRLLAPNLDEPEITLRGGNGLAYPDRVPSGAIPVLDPHEEELKERYRRQLPPGLLDRRASASDSAKHVQQLLLQNAVSQRSWSFGRSDKDDFLTTAKVKPGGTGPIVTVAFLTADAPAEAIDYFVHLAAECTSPLEGAKIGDFAFHTENDDVILFLRHSTVVMLVKNKDNPVDLAAFARDLNERLSQVYR
jgi:hypothetical protein